MRIGEGLGTCLPNHLGVVVYTCLCLSLWGGGMCLWQGVPREPLLGGKLLGPLTWVGGSSGLPVSINSSGSVDSSQPQLQWPWPCPVSGLSWMGQLLPEG